MFKKTFLALAVAALIAVATGVPAVATPPESQKLRGMAGRSFAVDVSFLVGEGDPFSNCYGFDANGDWFDAALNSFFPGVLGTWEQRGDGVSTPYRAVVDLGEFGDLIQTGIVTPTGGMEGPQLSATTVVPAGLLGPDEVTLFAVGSEVESCAPPT